MNSYSCGRLLVGACVLLCASQSAQAFFCFNFAFGSDNRDRYRHLPPIAPPVHYAPHPRYYLPVNHQLPAPAKLLPDRGTFRPLPVPAPQTPASPQ